MDKKEIKGFIRGMGVAFIISALVFYTMHLNFKAEIHLKEKNKAVIVQEAREMGMIFISEVNNIETLTEDYIIKMAKNLGMVFKKERDLKD